MESGGSAAGHTNTQSEETPQSRYIPIGSTDPAWKYGYQKDKFNTNWVICGLCEKDIKGGVNRLKQHLAQVKGNVAPCRLVDNDIKQEIRQNLEEIRKKKAEKAKGVSSTRDEVNVTMGKEPAIEEQLDNSALDRSSSHASDLLMRQVGIKEAMDKKQRERVNQYVARWVYRSGIAFNAICNNDFLAMCQAVGQYGKNYKPPTYHEVSETLLKIEVDQTTTDLQPHRDMWKRYGCTIMTDAWSDRRRRSLMNILLNCELGSCFLKAIDASADSHTGEYVMNFLDGCIQEVGAENVLQIVTDNASENVLAGRLLGAKYPHIIWSSCAAHVIDLILEEFGKEQRIKTAIQKGRQLVTFIYSHTKTLSLMRKFTNKGEILRPGVTRFATAYLTLSSLLDKKDKLRLMFSSDEWSQSRWSKTKPGDTAQATVLAPTFWNQVSLAVKVCSPLVHLLRIVDGDKKPSLGFVYGELEAAKKDIMAIFRGVEVLYRPFINAINLKSKDRLNSFLHVAAYYLNPYYLYKDQAEIERNPLLMTGLIKCIEVFFPDIEIQDLITRKELVAYIMKTGSFGTALALRQCVINNDEYRPANWWRVHGGDAPHLQEMAMKILNLTSSASGCERNWSTFEGIHTKKRNKLEVKKLNDLVYVRFNAKLQAQRARKNKDPLLTVDSQHAMEFIAGDSSAVDDEVFPGDDLTWGNVAEAAGVDDILQPRVTRAQSRAAGTAPATSLHAINEDELPDDGSSDDGEPTYLPDDEDYYD